MTDEAGMGSDGTETTTDETEEKLPAKLPNICSNCVVRITLSANASKDSFLEKCSSTHPCPPSFSLLSSDKTVTADLWTRPETCCYLCSGLLQEPTLAALVGRCRELLAEYSQPSHLALTCTNLGLLQVRSFLAGVPIAGLSVKTVFKWLLGDRLCTDLNLELGSEDRAVTVTVEVKMPQEEFLWCAREPRRWPVYNFTTGVFKPAALERELGRAVREECREEMRAPGGAAVRLEVAVASNALFVGGRYTKNARNVSQSPWSVDGKPLCESIEEIIGAPLKSFFKADSTNMHAAGREDIDVRMLGSGRPFYMQLVNARIFPDSESLARIQEQINASHDRVKCHRLSCVTREQTDIVKAAQQDKNKEYRCIIRTEGEVTEEMMERLNGIRDLALDQDTPLRVLHRRTPLLRKRRILSVKARLLTGEEVAMVTKDAATFSSRLLVAEVVSESGTYIKEFVHGDWGRTNPCVGSILGVRCDILSLDVMGLKIDWPPPPAPDKEVHCEMGE